MTETPPKARGTTRLVRVEEDGDTVRVHVLDRGTRNQMLNAQAVHQYRAPQDATALLTRNGKLEQWHLPNTDPVEDTRSCMALRVDAARDAGLLRLDPLRAGAQAADAVIPLTAVPRLLPYQPTRSLYRSGALEAVCARPAPHGLPLVGASLASEQPSVIAQLRDKLEADAASGKHEHPMAPDAILHYLGAPLPQALPTHMLDPAIVRAAWIIPASDEDTREACLSSTYSLLTIAPTGRVSYRRLIDTPSLDLLPLALQAAGEQDLGVQRTSHWFASWLQQYTLNPDDLDLWPRGYADVPNPHATPLHEYVLKHVERVVLHIQRHIPPEQVAGVPSIEAYNLLLAHGDTEKAQARRQAHGAMAGAMEMMLQDTPAGRALLATVDSRRALHRAAARAFKVPLWVVRRLTTTPSEVIHTIVQQTFNATSPAHAIEAMGPSVRLRDLDDARAFGRLLRRTGLLTLMYHGYNDPVTFERMCLALSLAGRAWVRHIRIPEPDVAARLRDPLQPIYPGPDDAERDLGDYWRFAHSAVVAAVPPEQQGGRLWWRVMRTLRGLFATQSLPEIERYSARYHDVVVQTEPPIDYDPAQVGATTVLAPTTLPSGWTLQQLTTPAELDGEGSDMEHCVGTYASRVAANAIQIFSLRAPSPRSGRLTVEVSPGETMRWQVHQVRGRKNRAPTGLDEARARDEFLELLGTMEPPEVLRKAQAAYQRSQRRHQETGTFLARLIERHGDAAWERVQHCFPGSGGDVRQALRDAYRDANPDLVRREQRALSRAQSQAAGKSR